MAQFQVRARVRACVARRVCRPSCLRARARILSHSLSHKHTWFLLSLAVFALAVPERVPAGLAGPDFGLLLSAARGDAPLRGAPGRHLRRVLAARARVVPDAHQVRTRMHTHACMDARARTHAVTTVRPLSRRSLRRPPSPSLAIPVCICLPFCLLWLASLVTFPPCVCTPPHPRVCVHTHAWRLYARAYAHARAHMQHDVRPRALRERDRQRDARGVHASARQRRHIRSALPRQRCVYPRRACLRRGLLFTSLLACLSIPGREGVRARVVIERERLCLVSASRWSSLCLAHARTCMHMHPMHAYARTLARARRLSRTNSAFC